MKKLAFYFNEDKDNFSELVKKNPTMNFKKLVKLVKEEREKVEEEKKEEVEEIPEKKTETEEKPE